MWWIIYPVVINIVDNNYTTAINFSEWRACESFPLWSRSIHNYYFEREKRNGELRVEGWSNMMHGSTISLRSTQSETYPQDLSSCTPTFSHNLSLADLYLIISCRHIVYCGTVQYFRLEHDAGIRFLYAA